MALTEIPIELSSTPGIVDNSNSTAITIDSSENVGIGSATANHFSTAGATNILGVKGTSGGLISIAATGTNFSGIDLGTDTTRRGGMYSLDGSHLAFYTNATNSGGSLTERMRIDSSGNLLVGTTATDTAAVGFRYRKSLNAISSVADGGVSAYFGRRSSDGDIVTFRKDDATVGSIGSQPGSILQLISQGTELYVGTSGNAESYFDAPGGVAFSTFTTYDGQSDLGRNSARFDDIYATNGTIQTSDRNEKQDIEELSDAEQRVAVAAKGLLRKFRWISSVEENGDNARTHFGIIAQDLQAAFEAEGLDAGDYAMFINSTWTDEETGEERSRMGVRYHELLAFIIAAI